MMPRSIAVLLLALSMLVSCTDGQKEGDSSIEPVAYVNPFIGASTSMGAAGIYHGLGKTFPGAATPFGMTQVSPNTITGGDNGSGYSYEHTSIEGFALTQMSGVGWYGDLGNFLVMPATGKILTAAGTLDAPDKGYRSRYSKENEKASAGYYSVKLDDYNITAEMTATPHCGMFRFTFPENDSSRIQIDLARRVGGTSTRQYVRVNDDHSISGWMECTPDGGGWGDGDGHADYTVYFYAVFSKAIKNFGTWSAAIPVGADRRRESVTGPVYQEWVADAVIDMGSAEKEGKHLGFFILFPTGEGEEVLMKTGISFVSMEGAQKSLETEISGWDFDEVHQQARERWNKALGKIIISGGSEDEKVCFYTSLYHTMIDPRTFEDVNNYYIGGDKKAHVSENFTKRTIFSGWDVFRSQFPLQTLINPEIVNDMLNSLLTLSEESGKGYFERWELLNAYSGCMIGNPAISVLYDAWTKGIRDYDIDKAYATAIATCERSGNEKLGYTVRSDQPGSGSAGYAVGEFSISNTLELSYTEWCMAGLAEGLGRPDDYSKYTALSKSYRNIFDPEMGWFRARNEDGSWKPLPENGRITDWYGTVESNPYQQGWFVPHDVEGMLELMGGVDKVIPDLVSFFEKVPENMMWNDYYNHANEPVHHVPFLFNRLGSPWLTQKWSREICRRAYRNSVEGLVGNEDVGQMSAWYVLSSAGLYQLCPGDTRFEITSPVFDSISIHTDPFYGGNNAFTIVAHNNSKENCYISSAKLNGENYTKCYVDYEDILKGGLLELEMSSEPTYEWGSN